MIRCGSCKNEVEEYIWHDPHDSDLIHIRIECILCDQEVIGKEK